MLTIGDLSKTSGVKIPTIRYYEQMGLLPHAERSEGNQRRYTKEEMDRLTFIKHSRDLGIEIFDAACQDQSRAGQNYENIFFHVGLHFNWLKVSLDSK